MFSQACVKNSVRHPPGRQTPPPRQTPPWQVKTPLAGRHPLAGKHPPGRQTPPPADGYCYGMHPTGMHSCLTFKCISRVIINYFQQDRES